MYCSGGDLYCKPILDCIERDCSYFAHRVYGTHVLFENSSFSVKFYDFLLSHGRSPANTIIVDSHVATFALNVRCGVPAAQFADPAAKSDDELVRLARYLDTLSECENISETIMSTVNSTLV